MRERPGATSMKPMVVAGSSGAMRRPLRHAAYSASGKARWRKRGASASAASTPLPITETDSSKAALEKLPNGGTISTSPSPSEVMERLVFSCISTETIWYATSSGVRMSSRASSGLPTSTAITTSAPISRTTPTGRLSTMPPSTRMRPSISAGANTAGTAIEARTAIARSPSANTTRSPLTMSVAMARNGIGRSSKCVVCDASSIRRRSSRPSFCPCTAPEGSTGAPSRQPASSSAR